MDNLIDSHPSTAKENWCILGAGSIGCLIAYHFWMQKIPCQLLLKNTSHLENYQLAGGITLLSSSHFKERLAHQIQATPPATTPEMIHSSTRSPISHLFITTKAHQTEQAFNDYAEHISPTATIIILQNGMCHFELIQKRLPKAEIMIGTTTEGVNRSAPFTLHHVGKGVTWLGPSSNQINVPIQLAPLTTLKHAGFQVRWDPQIDIRLWEKLAINCAINALTIVYNCDNGFLLKNQESKNDLLALIEEITAFYQQHLPHTTPHLKKSILDVIMATAHNTSSSLQDWRAGKETELSHINGYLINLAHALGAELPLNQNLMHKISSNNPSAEDRRAPVRH